MRVERFWQVAGSTVLAATLAATTAVALPALVGPTHVGARAAVADDTARFTVTVEPEALAHAAAGLGAVDARVAGGATPVDPEVPEPLISLDPRGELDPEAVASLRTLDAALTAAFETAAAGEVDDGEPPVPTATEGTVAGPVDVVEVLPTLVPGITSIEAVGDDLYAIAGAGLDEEELAGLPFVSSVGVDTLGSLSSGDVDFGQQWALENTGQSVGGVAGTPGADIGWRPANVVADGSGIVVAIVDGAIDRTHPDLVDVDWWSNPDESCTGSGDADGNGYAADCAGWDFVDGDNEPYSTVGAGHGSNVTGIVAATAGNGLGGAGVAPGVTVMPVRIADGSGSFPMSRAAAGIRYAVANGADVINASFGSAPGAPLPDELANAVAEATAAGVLVVAAAGNDGADLDAAPVWPACLPDVLTVAASTSTDALATFSNRGPSCVDVVAPGERIYGPSSGGAYALYSGTSMAAPITTGVAALVAQHTATTQPTALRNAILAGAVPVEAFGGHVATPRRVHAAGALGLSGTSGPLRVAYSGLHDLPDGTTDATATISSSVTVSQLTWTLATIVDGVPHAVLGHEVQLTAGTWDSGPTPTDGLGRIGFATRGNRKLDAGGVLDVSLHTVLPPGRYAWMLTAGTAGGETAPLTVVFRVPEVEGDASGGDDALDGPPDEDLGTPVAGPDDDGGDTDGDGATDADGSGTSDGEAGDGGPTDDGADGDQGGPGPDEVTDETDPGTTDPEASGPGDDGGDGGADGDEPSTPADDGSSTDDDGGDEPPADDPEVDLAAGIRAGPDDVRPPSGPELGGTVVHVRTPDVDEATYVYFGTERVDVQTTNGSSVVVVAPPGAPGSVDVVVATGGRTLVRYLEAYTYLPPLGEDPVDEPGETTPDPDDGGDPPEVDDGPTGPTDGEPFQLSNGLTVVRLTTLHPLGGLTGSQLDLAECRADPCWPIDH